MSVKLRCLLMSPFAPPDPYNGDVQYTFDLLSTPPADIEYVTYPEALARGELEYGPSARAAATWRAPAQSLPAAGARAALHLLRDVGLLLPDPVRWVRVCGTFDLVHVHCFPVRFLGPRPPVLISDSAGTYWYWTEVHHKPARRVRRLLRREGRVAHALKYLHPTAYPAGEGLVYFVQSGVTLAAQIGLDTSNATICAPGVPEPRHPRRSDGRTVLFVGRAFEDKGGPAALAAFALVREALPHARLLVAGPDRPPIVPPGVEWIGRVTRDQLYDEVYPRADVFLYPTRFDCAPLVAQEALAHGQAVVTTRLMGMPDLVRDGETGILFEPGDVTGAAAAVISLLGDREALARMQAAARADFEGRMSISHRNEVLGALYRSVAGVA